MSLTIHWFRQDLRLSDNPWEATENVLSNAGIILRTNYPKPIADLKESRDRALEVFASLKDSIQ